MYFIIDKFLAVVGFLALAGLTAATIALYLVRQIKRNETYIANGVLVENSRRSHKKAYWDHGKHTDSARWFIMDSSLLDYEPELRNLERIPSGRVSKLFIQGRGSWRLTQGNILTKDGLDESIRKEFSKML